MRSFILSLEIVLLAASSRAATFNQDYIRENQWRLSRNYAEANLGVSLFATVTGSALLVDWNCGVSPADYPVKFVVDSYWCRVIYGREDAWVQSFGGYGTGDGQFRYPEAIAVTPEGLVFVADRGNARISVFYYENINENVSVQFLENIPVPSSEPIDVIWDDAGNADFACDGTPSDCIWVLCRNGDLYKFKFGFDHYSRNFSYTQAAGFASIVPYPRSIAKGRAIDLLCDNCDEMGNDGWLYVSDGANRIKCFTGAPLSLDNPDNPRLVLRITFDLPSDCVISDISVDPLGTIWVVDSNRHRILKYYNNQTTLVFLDQWGTWGRDDNAPDQLAWPKCVAFGLRVIDDANNPGELIYLGFAGMTIGEYWDEHTGGINGSQGITIKDLTAHCLDPVTRLVRLSFFKTSYNSDFREPNQQLDIVIRNYANQVVRALEYVDPPGSVQVVWDGHKSDGTVAPPDIYTFEVSGYCFGDVARTSVSLNTNSPPSFASFYLDPPGCFSDRTPRSVRYRVTDPNLDNSFHFHWTVDNGHISRDGRNWFQELNYDEDGYNDRSILFIPPPDWAGLDDLPRYAAIICNLSDIHGQASYGTSRSVTAHKCSGDECPFLFVVSGNDTLMQNNILNSSIDTSGMGRLVYDYLFLTDRPQPQAGRYNLMVRELEYEIDSLDWAGLVTIDHSTGTQVLASGRGNIYELLALLPPSSAHDKYGNDVLGLISQEDGVYYSEEDSGWLDITYSGLDTFSMLLDGTGGGTVVPPPPKYPTPTGLSRPLPNILSVSLQDSSGNWAVVETIYPRRNSHRTLVDLTNYLSGTVNLKYSWTRKYQADFIGFAITRNLREGITLLRPSMARLNDTLNITTALRSPDRIMSGFSADEHIDIAYSFNPIPPGLSRDFVFVCRGKYSTPDSLFRGKAISEAQLPREFSIYQNYPNPFNSTTLINFDLPELADVELVIFNILGQRVVSLSAKKLPAGHHSVTWDGKNQDGSPVSSGVYFARLAAGDKVAVKKMILLR